MNQFAYFCIIIYIPQHSRFSNQSNFCCFSRRLLLDWFCHFMYFLFQFFNSIRRIFPM